jgi:hypothetical protein
MVAMRPSTRLPLSACNRHESGDIEVPIGHHQLCSVGRYYDLNARGPAAPKALRHHEVCHAEELTVSVYGNIYVVPKIRRGGYIFVAWVGDHSPRHVHVYRDGKLIVKWDLDNWQPMKGRTTARITRLLRELVEEGTL